MKRKIWLLSAAIMVVATLSVVGLSSFKHEAKQKFSTKLYFYGNAWHTSPPMGGEPLCEGLDYPCTATYTDETLDPEDVASALNNQWAGLGIDQDETSGNTWPILVGESPDEKEIDVIIDERTPPTH